MVGVQVPPHSYLHMLAVDLARSPDGQWWVLADRTQAPSGSGYALENRTIVSDLLPELFRESNVQRLAPFFRAQREALIAMAPGDNPRDRAADARAAQRDLLRAVVPRQVPGLHAGRGSDLTVRERCVYLKTVSGLEQVDVILRRVDDGFCDPLELRGDSLLGVPGLVDAVVAGNVTVANALGSGLIESAAIMPFLPGLARHLLGEELKLPSVATWWCGQPSALDWVLHHLESVVVKPAFPSRGMEPVFGSELPEAQRAELIERLRRLPHEYVAQEQVALSTAPVWEDDRLHAAQHGAAHLRAAYPATGWVAMPGGLVRVSEAERHRRVHAARRPQQGRVGAVRQPVDTFSMLRPVTEPLELRRASRVVPSGVADNTFWLGRYVERAENMARILRSMVPRVRRGEEPSSAACSACTLLGSHQSKLPQAQTPPHLCRARKGGALDADGPQALGQPALHAGGDRTHRRQRARAPFGGHDAADRPTAHCHAERPGAPLPEYSVMLTECLELLSAFSGMERENLIRGSGWLFMSLGRRLERAIYLTRQLRVITRPLRAENWAIWSTCSRWPTAPSPTGRATTRRSSRCRCSMC